jgi:hypothetical protein
MSCELKSVLILYMKQLIKVCCRSTAEYETCKFQIASTSNYEKEKKIHIKITLIYRESLVNVKQRLVREIFSYQEENFSTER